MTARQLLAALRPFAPAFDPATGKYRLKPGAPPDLVARFRVLKVGVAALLTNRAWLGLFPTGHMAELSPDDLVPPDVGYLSLLPDAGGWDRIPSAARLDFPDLFAAPAPAGTPAKRRPARKKVRR